MNRKFILAALLCLAPSLAFGQARYDTFFVKTLPTGGVGAVSGLATVCPGAGLATTAASVTGNVATLTFGSNPITAGFVSGRNVLVVNFSGTDTYFNGTFTISTVTASTITYPLTHANNSASTTGGAIQTPTAASGCAPTTTVYSDQGLTAAITQPFADDGKGNVGFFGAPGNYYVAYSASGLNPMPLNFVTLPVTQNAAGNIGAINAGAITATTINASGPITGTHITPSATPSLTGIVRLSSAAADAVNWRNTAGNGDVGFTLNGGFGNVPADTMQFNGNAFLASAFVANDSQAALSGALRLGKGQAIGWRNFANTGDLSLAKNTSDQLTFGGVQVAGFTDVGKTYNAAGTSASNPHFISDVATLVSGTPSTVTVTLSGSAVFTSSATYQCLATDKSNASALKISLTNGSTFVITGPNTVTDVVAFWCGGT